jgi:[ribosomal protein S18]-alanine N-acetyltransferase
VIFGLKDLQLRFMMDRSKFNVFESNMQIREYCPPDFDEINQLWQDIGLGGSFRGDDEKTIEATLKAGGKLFVLQNLSSGEIIGTSWLTTDQRRIYLHHFGIKTAFQGKGLAWLLMEKSMDFARSACMQIKLEVHKDNQKAIQLYEKWGFKYLGKYFVYIVRDYKSMAQNA